MIDTTMLPSFWTHTPKLMLLFGAMTASTATANVYGLFPSGADAKSAAMETAIDSREPQTLLYNPAVLRHASAGFQGEVGIGRLLYSYEHPSFDPVRVSLFTPVVSAGWRSETINRFNWGLALSPSSMASLSVKGLPRRISGKPESLDVQTVRRQFHIPLGASWAPFADTNTTFGLSLIATYDQRTLQADSIIDGNRLVDLTAKGLFFRPVVGGLHDFGPLELGLSYTAPVTKHYKGSTKLVSEANEFDTEQVDYDPAIVATGARFTHDDWTASLNVNRLFGSRGKDIVRDGVTRKTKTADLRDVNHLGVRVGWHYNDQQDISVAYAYLPTMWGAGSFGVDQDGIPQHEIGHIFGTFNAMPVRNQAVAWRYRGEDWTFHSALFRTAGVHTIDSSGDNPGHYQLEFVSITSGIARSL